VSCGPGLDRRQVQPLQHPLPGRRQNLLRRFESKRGAAKRWFCQARKAHQTGLIPIPAGVDPALAGRCSAEASPCFAPLIDEAILPTAHVAVIGIGGLGHLALAVRGRLGLPRSRRITTRSRRQKRPAVFGCP